MVWVSVSVNKYRSAFIPTIQRHTPFRLMAFFPSCHLMSLASDCYHNVFGSVRELIFYGSLQDFGKSRYLDAYQRGAERVTGRGREGCAETPATCLLQEDDGRVHAARWDHR